MPILTSSRTAQGLQFEVQRMEKKVAQEQSLTAHEEEDQNRSGFQIASYNGIKYSSPTLSAAMSNVNPAFTFILAIIFRMEIISLNKKSSIAKILGTIVSIIGALVVTLYHGPLLLVPVQHSLNLPARLLSPRSDWVLGGSLLALHYILLSVSYLVMVNTKSTKINFILEIILVYNICIAVVCAFVTLLTEKDNPNAWILRFDTSFIRVLAVGILNALLLLLFFLANRSTLEF